MYGCVFLKEDPEPMGFGLFPFFPGGSNREVFLYSYTSTSQGPTLTIREMHHAAAGKTLRTRTDPESEEFQSSLHHTVLLNAGSHQPCQATEEHAENRFRAGRPLLSHRSAPIRSSRWMRIREDLCVECLKDPLGFKKKSI